MKIFRIGDLSVKEAYIDLLALLPARIDFHLIAPEEAGKRLETRLKELEKEHAIGLCDVTGLAITKDESKTPLLY